MEKKDDWSSVCEIGGPEEVEAWVMDRKMDAFDEDLQGLAARSLDARALADKVPALRKVTGEEMTERIAVLIEGLLGRKGMLDAVTALPELLALTAAKLKESFTALQTVFSSQQTRRVALQMPKLLLDGATMGALFDKLREHFPQIAVRRLQERTEGEWALWPKHVEETGEAVHIWLGRIGAEEREADSKEKVQLSGMHGKVRADLHLS